MGIVKDAVLLKTIERVGRTEAELLAQLLAEQQKTNQLLAQLVQALSGPVRAQPTTSWGQP